MDTQFIKIYDSVLSTDLCDRLIAEFENRSNFHENFNDEYKKFKQLTLTNTELIHEVVEKMKACFFQYIKDCQLSEYQVPKKFGYEGLRIKKYYDESCCFDPHVDVVDYISSKRFISFLFYLNDDFEEGNTIFYTQDEPVLNKPKQGSVLLFPPLWTYPHKGDNPKNGQKYIMSSYFNFIE